MQSKSYAEIYYIFDILSTARQGAGIFTLRRKTSCNGIRFKRIITMLVERNLLGLQGGIYFITIKGKDILDKWDDIVETLDMCDGSINPKLKRLLETGVKI